MSGVKQTVPSAKGWSTLVRPKFGPGMLLQHEDLEQLHGYTRELNRLLFRNLFGCGVVCGLVVKPEPHCGKWRIKVDPGLALNCTGDPIHVPKEQTLDVDTDCNPSPDTPLWVILCPSTKCCAPRTSMCPTDDEETSSSCTRERDGFEIQVVKDARCSCHCPDQEKKYGQAGHGSGEEKADDGSGDPDKKQEHLSECWCVDPNDPCYSDHYLGTCGCSCIGCAGGGCDCVVLSRLDFDDKAAKWTADHRVRRFIRPVLIRDPRVQFEKEELAKAKAEAEQQGKAYAASQVEAEKPQTKGKKSQKSARF
jgi:hypothetical protein